MATFALQALALHREHAPHIADLCGRAVPFRPVVRYELAFNDTEAAALQPMQSLYNSTEGFSASRVDRSHFLHEEPLANPSLQSVLRLEGNYLVDAAAYTGTVRDAARTLGARHVTATVHGFQREHGRVIGVMTDQGPLHAAQVVLAAGAWLGELVAELGFSLPISPVKGQLLHIRHPARGVMAHHLSRGGTGIYAHHPGEFLIGGTQEQVGFDANPTAEGREDLWRQAEVLLPGIRATETCAQLVGFRPTFPDLQPMVGHLPEHGEVIVLGGGWSKGMLYAPALAEAAVGLITQAPSLVDLPAELSVARFKPSV
jgi:glycine oxidase